MLSESHHHGANINPGKKGGFLPSTQMSWTQLDEDFPAPEAVVDKPLSPPRLVDHKEKNLCNWMDSGFYLSASGDLQDSQNKAADLSPSSGMVQMTVQNYMRSLHQFSEMPVLSRWNSAGSSHSLPSAPKSVTEWLDFSEKDPVEILLDLGFGTDEPDICTKIPSRFISCASIAKGINIRVFIEAQRKRMDIESPNLCGLRVHAKKTQQPQIAAEIWTGFNKEKNEKLKELKSRDPTILSGRFRQLEVLDHVTSAFSSLLHDINTLHHKSEERTGEENGAGASPKRKLVVTQAKRRKISQLLRKVSRQPTVHGPQVYRNAGTCQAKEDNSSVNVDLDMPIRTGLPENPALVPLKEEPFPSEKEARPPQSIASKPWVLPHLPAKLPHLPSTSEMLIKDRPRKEPSMLLSHTLRRVSSLNCKPSDSFEMEEIQSFEDESSWGNPLESTSDEIVTRTNSCQSDSSGFLEDPAEPLPLQGPSLPGNLRLSCNSNDCQTFLRQRKDSALTSQDLPPSPNISRADAGNTVPLPSLSREHTFQGEEIFYSINEEDDTCSGLFESATEETLQDMDEKVLQGQQKREDSCVIGCTSQPCHTDSTNPVGPLASPLDRNGLSSPIERHQSVNSVLTEGSCVGSIGLGGCQNSKDTRGSEERLTEGEGMRDSCEDVFESFAEYVEGKYSVKGCRKLDSHVVEDVASGFQETDINGAVRSLDVFGAPKTKHDILRSPLHDPNLSPHCFKDGAIRASETLSAGVELDEEGTGNRTNANLLKSVTVQMPSRLMSTMRSFSLGEAAAKGQYLDFVSKEEPQIASVPGTSKEDEKQVREVSIQTDRSSRKRAALSLSQSLPSFHGHGHLVKSASLDTGLYGKYRSYCLEPFNAWCAHPGGPCYPFSSHHCCLLWPFPSAPSCRHSVASCSSPAAIELQLLKTLKLLQDTAMRNISSCTVHEIEVMRNSCQKFRERLDEIEQHMTEQEALFSSAMTAEGREERRELQVLRQAVRREVAELEGQLHDRARQVREGILMQLNQLLGEQSNLCSELGISNRVEEGEPKNGHAHSTLPDTAGDLFSRAGYSRNIHRTPPSRSATVPSSPSSSLVGQTGLNASSAFATSKASSASDPKELHTSKKEAKSQKIDFKGFIQNLKKSFRNSFSNDTAEGKD